MLCGGPATPAETSAADVFIAAQPRTFGITVISVRSRTGGPEIMNGPNWPSTTDRSPVQINDFD